MLLESIKACEELLVLKTKHLQELNDVYNKYKDSECLSTFNYLKWKVNKSNEDIIKLEYTSGLLLKFLIPLQFEIQRLKQDIKEIEYKLNDK